jgi:Fe-S-cluster containining protein
MAGTIDGREGQRVDTVYSLGFHAGFLCRQSGMCCHAGTSSIQVEAAEREGIIAALNDGRLSYPPGLGEADDLFQQAEPPAGQAPGQADATDPPSFLRAGESSYCVFLDPERGNDCRIHAQQGPEMLPMVCQTYPRNSSRAGAGTQVSLSLGCPTAVAMLFEDSGPIEVVADPAGLGHETLMTQVISELPPPKLTPGMRLARDSYHEWELRCVEILSGDKLTPELALLAIASTLEQARVQQGGEAIDSTFMKALVQAGTERHRLSALRGRIPSGRAQTLQHVRTVLGFEEHPDGGVREMQGLLKSRYGGDEAAAVARFESDDVQFVAGPWPTFSLPLRRYIASRVFDNRLAWETAGMRSTVFALVLMLASVRVLSAVRCGMEGRPLDQGVLEEAIRFTDRLLNFRHIGGGVKQMSLNYFDGAEAAAPEVFLASLAL